MYLYSSLYHLCTHTLTKGSEVPLAWSDWAREEQLTTVTCKLIDQIIDQYIDQIFYQYIDQIINQLVNDILPFHLESAKSFVCVLSVFEFVFVFVFVFVDYLESAVLGVKSLFW